MLSTPRGARRWLGVLVMSLVSCNSTNAGDGQPAPAKGGIAVVELFTSQGCSSCPPADEFLNGLVASAEANHAAVYPIAFHIDYWDRLGWKDPFSSREASQRQAVYTKALAADTYTPQMVVNGRVEFVGSDRGRAQTEIAGALSQAAEATVDLRASRKGDQSIDVNYAVTGAPKGAALNLVVVERGLSTAVLRGENAGVTMKHENVARAIQAASLDQAAAGKVTIALPAGLDDRRIRVIGFVQEPSMKISGASVCQMSAAGSPTK